MLLLVGASASGKTEIANLIINKYNFNKMVTYTTRPKRIGEVDGVDYYFIDEDQFLNKKENSYFLETTKYNNYYYGTAFKDADKNKILIVDVNGVNNIYNYLKNDVIIFLLEAPKKMRIKRMIKRGDSRLQIKSRIQNDKHYFIRENIKHIDYIIDTSIHSLDELADKIYNLYINHEA